jgi:small-conductance mechanosensitive channel
MIFLKMTIFDNTIEAYLVSLLVFMGVVVALNLVNRFILRRLAAIPSIPKIGTFALDMFEKMIVPLIYVGALYFAAHQLKLTPGFEKLVNSVAVIALVIQATRLGLAVAMIALKKFWMQGRGPEFEHTGGTLLTIFQFVVWGLAAVFVLDNLGFNVSAVVAGLGIGGVAVALAAQTILGDLFNYFVIYFDRPFECGDFIIVNDYMGQIEHIGIKTTRIRSLSGEQIVCANSDLTASRIRNYKRMQKRRVVFQIGVTYQTDLEKLRRIPEMIRSIIGRYPQAQLDRVHFAAFGDSSLNFEVVYFVLDSDYNKYMDIQQGINLAIVEIFARERIEFAYPTRTLFLDGRIVSESRVPAASGAASGAGTAG